MSGEILTQSFTLKQCLAEFLNSEMTEMPTVELDIVEQNPLKITDDGRSFFESTTVQEQILDSYFLEENLSYRIQLLDWSFVFKKVPNSHDYYVDIKLKKFEVRPSEPRFAEGTTLTNILEDVEIK